LIATLGGKPQVLTFALDALLAAGLPIERVLAIHLSPEDPRIQRSINLLRHEFETFGRYRGRLHFDTFTIRASPNPLSSTLHALTGGRAVASVEEPAAPDAIWLTTHRLVMALKTEGYGVALCVTGGPRLVGLQAMSAASLLFGSHDRCVHLFTPTELRERAGEGAVLHAPPDGGVRLIPVPLLPLGLIAPSLQAAASATPEDVIGERRRVMSAQDAQRCRDVIRNLTPRQREVLREFARDGADVQGVADKLHITANTLNSHKTHIYDECRNAWGLPHDAPLTHRFLRERFGDLPDDAWADWLRER
jgi:CRISPR-associated protein Csx14